MKVLLGRKVGMSQMFSPLGEVVCVTLVSAEPNQVTIRRLESRDGYVAVQLALPKKYTKKSDQKNTTGEVITEFEAKREFEVNIRDDVKESTVANFEIGDIVNVIGTSKGKGYQGVVKRHGFAGGPASHGHRHVLRSGGSIGSAFPQHVIKGKRMAGRMGGDRITVKNLIVSWIDETKNLIAIKGAIPGAPGSIIEIHGEFGKKSKLL